MKSLLFAVVLSLASLLATSGSGADFPAVEHRYLYVTLPGVRADLVYGSSSI